MSRAEQLSQQLYGSQQPSMGAFAAIKEAVLAVAPGLKNIGKDLKEEATYQLGAGAHELAAALYNGSAFVMYPRGTRDDDQHRNGPEQGQQHEQQLEQGRSM
jgi:hypothetical protein